MSKAYKESGVNLEAGYEVVQRIKKHVQKTHRKEVLGGLGAFGGLFDLSALNMKEPVLVSGTDGVGTKLELAKMFNQYGSIGQDLVAMCVNDIVAQGAAPLFFLDYVAVGKNYPDRIEKIIEGICDGCELAGCALLGGETAEMPGIYGEDDFDLAGFTVGAVEKSKIITPEKVNEGDVIIGLPSSGIHSNGYSLVRKIILQDQVCDLEQIDSELGRSLKEELLVPTKIYVKPILRLLENVDIHGIAHITGGGFYENIPRCLKKGQGAEIQRNSWNILPIFKKMQHLAKLEDEEMFNVFNMGIGMVLVVAKEDEKQVIEILEEMEESPVVLGKVVGQEGIKFYD